MQRDSVSSYRFYSYKPECAELREKCGGDALNKTLGSF